MPRPCSRTSCRPIVFVDLETAGSDATVDRITEIDVVEASTAGIERWSVLVDPGVPVPPFIERLTGIDDAMLRGQPTFESLAPALPEGTLKTLPSTPGVYLFHGDDAMPLYVGKSINLRQRVASHFSGDHRLAKDLSISQAIRRIECRETVGELGALLLEAKLVKACSRRIIGC
ncbi:DNA polymerase III epsilon subunit [Candidatus Burkholderia pumila]|uniref:Excinuclease cho n=1 Tax=Candidatus Burkholderia pumila TaxID=1090375 RepID=A0ABR5HLX0_9BURK|nr:DNA polymerase III epsilon subunit [Candidatus Burkholderia pumila]